MQKPNLRRHLLTAIPKLHYPSSALKKIFLDRLLDSRPLLQSAGALDHFCAFFAPVHVESSSIFVGHHIKANKWFPPGGHIEQNELPNQTVKREAAEELRYRIEDRNIVFFDLSTVPITNRKEICTAHYDLWHYFLADRLSFPFDRGEFYEAGWMSFDEAIKKASQTSVRLSLRHLKETIQ
ncbi:NUDIX domain-containing protein [Candidatus Roizmanbacteria bacterium]|nr:NUDIX domain-containing protein [Candidatus Roizmanbacteria bacterium]